MLRETSLANTTYFPPHPPPSKKFLRISSARVAKVLSSSSCLNRFRRFLNPSHKSSPAHFCSWDRVVFYHKVSPGTQDLLLPVPRFFKPSSSAERVSVHRYKVFLKLCHSRAQSQWQMLRTPFRTARDSFQSTISSSVVAKAMTFDNEPLS